MHPFIKVMLGTSLVFFAGVFVFKTRHDVKKPDGSFDAEPHWIERLEQYRRKPLQWWRYTETNWHRITGDHQVGIVVTNFVLSLRGKEIHRESATNLVPLWKVEPLYVLKWGSEGVIYLTNAAPYWRAPTNTIFYTNMTVTNPLLGAEAP